MGYKEELSLYFEKDIKGFENFIFKELVNIYYTHKKDTLRDFNLKIFNSLDRTKQLKNLIKLCLKENKSFKLFWGGF